MKKLSQGEEGNFVSDNKNGRSDKDDLVSDNKNHVCNAPIELKDGSFWCTKCGLELGRDNELTLYDGDVYRQPTNALHWDMNLGTDGRRERNLIIQLRKKGQLKRLTSFEYSKMPYDGMDDALTKALLGKLQQRWHDPDFSMTHRAGLLARKKLKLLRVKKSFITEKDLDKIIKNVLKELGVEDGRR